MMRLSDYDYPLSEDLVAQEPAGIRDRSCLMVLDRAVRVPIHKQFNEITEFLRPGDLLVFNDTRVVSARLSGTKKTGGALEIFLLQDKGGNLWETLIRGKVVEGTVMTLEGGEEAAVEALLPDGKRIVRFSPETDVYKHMERHGNVPLPPYIRRNGDKQVARQDRERYQTVYARRPGAVAAPTAGLHFTEALMEKIERMGVETAFITLHVGYGTFKPVTVTDIREHKMDREDYTIGKAASRAVNNARREGRRVIAVGTTTTRALESSADPEGKVLWGEGSSDLFIYPGYRFRVVQGLITNFHLPRSTLLMLVAAFAGKEFIDRAYEEARECKYRFYSYGDVMLIL
jgi:S-adenosylmethionine:tRNA ribosyltransferase-isomerase